MTAFDDAERRIRAGTAEAFGRTYARICAYPVSVLLDAPRPGIRPRGGLTRVELVCPGVEMRADVGDRHADVWEVLVVDALMRPECLRKDGEIEAPVCLRG